MISQFVSVIVCTYKREQYLENCLKSIFNQTYKNIDNGGTGIRVRWRPHPGRAVTYAAGGSGYP
jgi:hypothetical protein